MIEIHDETTAHRLRPGQYRLNIHTWPTCCGTPVEMRYAITSTLAEALDYLEGAAPYWCVTVDKCNHFDWAPRTWDDKLANLNGPGGGPRRQGTNGIHPVHAALVADYDRLVTETACRYREGGPAAVQSGLACIAGDVLRERGHGNPGGWSMMIAGDASDYIDGTYRAGTKRPDYAFGGR